jgi:DNA-binding NarL/FixJ family response regulator
VFVVLFFKAKMGRLQSTFPRCRALTSRRGPDQQRTKDSGGVLSYSILIVDDNALVRHTLRACIEQDSVLQACGEAMDGEVAVRKVKELRPDIVILDLQMPVMNGLDAARQIKQLSPKTAMLMLTMYKSQELVNEAHAAGIKMVLSKFEGNSQRLLSSLKSLCHAC